MTTSTEARYRLTDGRWVVCSNETRAVVEALGVRTYPNDGMAVKKE